MSEDVLTKYPGFSSFNTCIYFDCLSWKPIFICC